VDELKWLFLVLIILLLLFILIIFTKLSIYINYYHYKDNDDLKIEIRAWFGLIRFKKHIPLIKIDDDSPSIVMKEDSEKQETKVSQITSSEMKLNMKNYKEILRHVVQLHSIVRSFLKKVSLKKLEWHSVIGVGDAAYTGMSTGALWAIKGSILGVLSHYLRMVEMPELMVTPDFNRIISQTKLICIFQFRIGNAMLAGLKLIKFWKGGRPKFKTNKMMSNEKPKSV
jgi:hypothetical protein